MCLCTFYDVYIFELCVICALFVVVVVIVVAQLKIVEVSSFIAIEFQCVSYFV